MATALTIEQYLDRNGIAYDVLHHEPTMSSLRTAEASRVPANEQAKSVVLKKDRGYLFAVLPASQQLEWQALRMWLDQNLAFQDIAPGPKSAMSGLISKRLRTSVQRNQQHQR